MDDEEEEEEEEEEDEELTARNPAAKSVLNPIRFLDKPSVGRAEEDSRSSSSSDLNSPGGDTRQLVVTEQEGLGDNQQRYGLSMTTFNFINSIIGSGIIGMPYSLKQAGFGLGILLLLFVALISDYSILLLVQGGLLSNSHSYQDVVLAAFGRPGFYTLTVLQFIYPFIAMVSYNVIIGDTITKIVLWMAGNSTGFVHDVLGNRRFVICIVTLLVTLPLSLYRNIGKLAKWALLSIVMIFFIIITVAIRLGTFAKDISPTEHAWEFADSRFIQGIGIVSFSFMCHHNTLLVHSSMEKPTQRRWNLVVHVSVMFAVFMCLLTGVMGYISFTGNTQGDLLENYCKDDVLMNCARFAFALTIMLTYPIECFVTREVMENVVFPSNRQPAPLWRHITTTVIIVCLTAGVSLSTDCLGIVIVFNGVLFAAPLAFIFPPCSVIRLRPDPLLSRCNVGPALLALFGLLVMVMGTIVTVLDTVHGVSTCSHGAEPAYCLSQSATTPSVLFNVSASV
ncbi:putative sodium-coupled neutral amino acid transporter 11 [Babylonia areolata]|uniref:putative sodium-coupled neutral amino acid transporter 11 n=1 Tax=Babylonia areolata TaxID=304850 RepID=UPI003FD59D69